ncbi:hypothetical protein [Acidiphilium sp.]|uniref:hypothetical protein n=1 Tax=Acidiphilium sp. TaxID=527 RepID=UPI003D06C0CF
MFNEPNEAEVSDEVTEARIRRSLGLTPTAAPASSQHQTYPHAGSSSHGGHGPGGSSQPRRRFVRDGEVPVVILHPKSEGDNRHAAALADMTRQRDSERAARLRAEQSLHEAQLLIQSLQTRLAHADIERTERTPPAVPETAPAPDLPNPVLPSPVPATVMTTADPEPARLTKPVARPRRTRPAAPPAEAEPTPVKWWR